MGKKFRIQGQHLKHVEWRSALELPADLIVREARAADVILVGPTRSGRNVHDLVEPGAILLGRAGRPWWCRRSSVHSRFVASWSRARMPVNAAARSATRCRFCGRPMKSWLSRSGKKIQNPRTSEIWPTSAVISRATVSLWRMKSGSAPADRLQRTPGASPTQNADLIVSGGYGHSRWVNGFFGGVTRSCWHQARCAACCRIEIW